MFFKSNKLRAILASLAFLPFFSCAAGDDLLYWVDFLAEFRLHKKVKLKADQGLWYTDDRLYMEETTLMLELSVFSWLSIAAGDRVVDRKYDESDKWRWKYEHRPMLDVILKQELWGFRFDWRNRLEYRDKEATRRNYLRYRGRLRARTPWEWTDWRISPYASIEAFVEDKPGLGKNEMFNRSRLLFGMSMRPAKHTTLSLFYMLQQERSGDSGWHPFHVPGMELKFEF
jgi:hypothetical protein